MSCQWWSEFAFNSPCSVFGHPHPIVGGSTCQCTGTDVQRCGFSCKVRQETSIASLGQPKAPSLGRPGSSLWPTGIGYGDRGEGRTPTHDIQQQGTRGIAKYASFLLPPWRFLSRLHGCRCRADAALLLLERANLGAVGLAVDLRLPRGFVCQARGEGGNSAKGFFRARLRLPCISVGGHWTSRSLATPVFSTLREESMRHDEVQLVLGSGHSPRQRSASHVIASMDLRCFALGGRGSFMCSGSKCSCDFLLHCRNSSIQETTSSWSGGREKLPRLKSRPIFSARASMSNMICGMFTLKSRRGTFSSGIPSMNSGNCFASPDAHHHLPSLSFAVIKSQGSSLCSMWASAMVHSGQNARVIIVAPCMDIPERARSSRISIARPSIRSQRVSKRGSLVPNAATAVPRRR